ncbi:MAG: 50S ribosomal protein L23 [Proteobacteria bacterium]|nr:50S ribosomal protein L23 [Pseudomonadota bacterium]
MNERMEKLYQVIIAPAQTEKALRLSETQQKRVFKVAKCATKSQIKAALEKIFEVKVSSVNIINVPEKKKIFRGRQGVRNSYKKAVVTFNGIVDFDSVFGG